MGAVKDYYDFSDISDRRFEKIRVVGRADCTVA